MASQNNGEGPPNGNGAGDRPGSYAKIAGVRRRRGRRKQLTSTRPPASPAAAAEPLEPEARGERDERDEDGGLDEPFEPPVDDLRGARPAPRRPLGPLGMDDARRDPGGAAASVNIAPVRVVEIGSPPHGSDNSNDARARDDSLARGAARFDRLEAEPPAVVEPRLAHAPAQIDEPFAPSSSPPPRSPDEDRYADEQELRAAAQPPPEAVPAATLVGHEPGGFTMGAQPSIEAEMEGQQGFSTVFHARPSLRPSPPPPPRSALGWWVVILLLSSIIVAAVVVAVREEMGDREAPPYQAQPAPEPAPAPERAPATPARADEAPAAPAPAAAAPAPAPVAPDAGVKASPAAKPARAWKPRAKPAAADAGAKPGARAPGPFEPPPVEAVPANPYGSTP